MVEPNPSDIQLSPERDALLTDFGKRTLENQYLLENETYQGLFARVSCAFATNLAHAQRLYDYMSQLWFTPATPVLANGGTEKRGLPISCFLNEAGDSLKGIVDLWTENAYLASNGGGIGSYWGNVRSLGESMRQRDTTSGIMPFIKVMESISLAINQGSLRRGAAAAYLPIWHPEIEEFMDLRKPTGGDHNRRSLYLHHGVVVTDDFMHAVENDDIWPLKSPHTGKIVRQDISARNLWIRLLTSRIETGEPYILFIDGVNRHIPQHHKDQNLWVKMSNLCTEITLPTGMDQHGKERSAVCCLSSVNVERYLQWKDHPNFIMDIMEFLDNILTDFIRRAPPEMARAVYSAQQERSVGLGVMGFHAFCQSQFVPLESPMARVWNKRIFSHIYSQAKKASRHLAETRGPCPDAEAMGIQERFSNTMAIAPNASTSIICGGTSPGIEPFVSNAYTHKTLSGSFMVRNSFLEKIINEKDLSSKEKETIWSSIVQHEGSIQHLSHFSPFEKEVFKTAFEINQLHLIDLAAQRQPYICQSQSLNIFLSSDVHKEVLHTVHYAAWKKGLKSLYYLRSRSLQRPENAIKAQYLNDTQENKDILLPMTYEEKTQNSLLMVQDPLKDPLLQYDECLSCQ